jgi:hypothetical protein
MQRPKLISFLAASLLLCAAPAFANSDPDLAAAAAAAGIQLPAEALIGESDFSKIMQEADKLNKAGGNPAPAPAAAAMPPAAPAQMNTSALRPDTPREYAPDDCEFRMVLPGEPEEFRHCDPADPKKCSLTTTYTRVFDMKASIDFTLTCLPTESGMFEKYSAEAMGKTLATVAKDKLEKLETSYQEYTNAKEATVLGSGKQGVSNMIYIAQLWIGRHSLFTVEARLVGEQVEEADKMFADTIKTIGHNSWKTSAGGVPMIPPEAIVPAAPDKAAQKAPAPSSPEPAAGTPTPGKKAGKPKPAAPAN